jgi:DNA-binding MarR family transcriptional regulator
MPGVDHRGLWVGYLKGGRLFFVLLHKNILLFVYFLRKGRFYALHIRSALLKWLQVQQLWMQQLRVQRKGSGKMSEFSRYVNTIDRHLRRRRREYMEPVGLKGIHARMIMAICANPGCSQDQLAKSMWFDKSTIARQIELLESKGFVTRQLSETDKRVLCVYPTQRMLEFQPGLKAAMQLWEDTLLQDLTEEEKQRLVELLSRVRERVDKEA